MQQMYPGKVNSPQTELSAAIDDTQDTIPLLDASVLPAPPNLATLGTGEDAETILYTGVEGNTLTGVTRGFQGVARAWAAGTKVARLFTAYDHEAFRANIIDHETRIEQNTSAAQQAQQTAQQVQQALAAHLNDTTTAHGINTKVSKSGDTMTGRLTVPEFELESAEITKIFDLTFGNVANEKVDIEIPAGSFYGSFEISLTCTWGVANAIGTITKLIHAGFRSDGTIDKNESIYLTASSNTSNHFAISDVIWDAGKSKYVIKIVHRSSGSATARIIVKAKIADSASMDIARGITFSGIYTTDTTVYPAPYDAKKYILVGTGSPEGVVTAPVGYMYLRTDGATGTTLYVKESGTGNTGWVAK